MADTLTTTTTLTNLLPIYLERRMIARLVPVERFYQFAEKRPLPANNGLQMTFTAWVNLAAASSTMTEGTANSLVALSARKVNVTVAQYGRGVKVTDLSAITAITDVIRDSVDILATSAALTVDNAMQLAIFKNVLTQTGTLASVKTGILSAYMSALASSFSANTGTSGSSNQFGLPVVLATGSGTRLSTVSKTAPTASCRASVYTVRKTRNALSAKDALPFADGYFVGVAHPNFLDTLGRDSTWMTWNQYQKVTATMYKGERGSVEQVRFVQSTNVPRFAVAAHSCHLTPIFGQQCYAATELDGGVKMMVKNPGPTTQSNPFDQYSTIAYKVNIVAALINPSAGRILISEELL
jgi:N4-gp56 family major capsid protein